LLDKIKKYIIFDSRKKSKTHINMKKLFALLSLTAFLAVSVNAQTTKVEAAPAKKEATSISKDSKSDSHSCCVKANAACCKNGKEASMKNCTPEQKAACAKAGKECSSHAKATKSTGETKAVAPAKTTPEVMSGPLE